MFGVVKMVEWEFASSQLHMVLFVPSLTLPHSSAAPVCQMVKEEGRRKGRRGETRQPALERKLS